MEKLEYFATTKGLSLYEALKFVGTDIIPRTSLAAMNSFRMIIEKNVMTIFNKTVKEIVEAVIEDTGYIRELELSDNPENQNRIENIKEFVSAVEEFQRISPDKTLSGYLSQIALVTDIDSWQDSEDKVTLMTLHLAKGLEFKNVFITGLEEGLFPIGESAYNEQELEEERRLMYVGMTRAKENLYMTWATERTVFGKAKWNVPSRFLLEAGFTEQLSNRTARNIINNTPFKYKEDVSYAPIDKVDDNDTYKIGTIVYHQVFGNGKIIEKSGSGDNLKLVVLFSGGQWRKLLAKFANLTIIK